MFTASGAEQPMILLLIPLALWLLKRTKLTQWWNPVSWWNDATNAAGGALDQVKQWVLYVVQQAVDLVESDVQDVLHFADWLYQQATNLTNWGFAVLNSAIRDVENWAQAAIGDAVNWADYLYNRAVGLADWLYGQAVAAARSLVGGAVSWAEGLIRFVEREAAAWVQAALAWANGAIGWAEHLARVWVDDAINFLKRHVSDVLAWLYRQILRDYIGPILDVIKYVKLAWDWVVWLAEHPFKVVHNVETDVIDWADHLPHELQQVAKGRAFMEGVDAMGKFLGG